MAIGTNPATGTLGGTAIRNAVAGLATFADLTINHAGTGYTLTASATGLTGATSTPFNVTLGTISATQSPVTVSSATVVSGSAVTLTLQGRDAGGNNLTTGGSTIVFTAPTGG